MDRSFCFVFAIPFGVVAIDFDTNSPHFETLVTDIVHCCELCEAELAVVIRLEIESDESPIH